MQLFFLSILHKDKNNKKIFKKTLEIMLRLWYYLK